MKRQEVKAFVDYYIENNDEIAKEAKFMPLTDEQKTTLKSEFESSASPGRVT